MTEADITLEDVAAGARSLIPVLRERAAAAEKARRIPAATITDFMNAGIFRILQPKRVGGYEFDYGPAQIAVARELGRGCGASAWVGVLIACHSWLIGMYPAEAQDDVWSSDPDTLIGTAFAPAEVKAEAVDGGYTLSGRWQWASGIDHCSWVIVTVPLFKGEGPPDLLWLLLPSSDYRVEDTWNGAGIRASGSNDVTADKVFVPAHRAVALDDLHGGPTPGSSLNPGTNYRLPVMMAFPYNVCAPILGTARGCIETFIERTRDRVGRIAPNRIAQFPTVQLRVSEAAAEIDCAELIAMRNAEEFNEIAGRGEDIGMELRVRYRRDIAYAATLCVRAVDRVVQILGAAGVADDNVEQRAFRDVHAMSQHIAVQWDSNAVGFSEHAFGLERSDKRL